MDIAEQITQLKADFDEVYSAGYEKGKKEGGDNPLYYAKQPQTLFIGADFPKDYELTLRFKNTPNSFQQMVFNANCPKLVKIIIENHTTSTSFQNAFRITSLTPNLISVDFGDICVLNDMFQCFDGQKILETVIGELDLSDCTGENTTTNVFRNCLALREVRFKEKSIPKYISLSYSPDISDETIDSIIDGLVDLTGQTSQKVYWHSTVSAKLTTERINRILAKNWELG